MAICFETRSLRELLSEEYLHIPSYQRPYKWQRKHIRNLFHDVRDAMQGKGKYYQLGSVILHQNGNHLDIVDGQQRLISLALFLQVIGYLDVLTGAKALLQVEFGEISCRHALENLQEWQTLVQLLDESQLETFRRFLLEKCTVSVITMPEERLSEAFQLFDSQNNRGRALAPHDLLKAYHLRTISDADETIVEKWEQFVDDPTLKLLDLFDQHLFRIRRWSRGETALTRRRYGSYLRFTEDFVEDFKGVDIEDRGNTYPYLDLYRQLSTIPTAFSMPILDGKNFFTFIEESHEKISHYKQTLVEKLELLPEEARQIISSPKGRYRRNFNLLLNLSSCFMERFGEEEFGKEILEIIFVWSYYPRVKARAIYDATLANYAAGGKFHNKEVQKLFQVLSTAKTPSDFLLKIDTSLLEYMTVEEVIEIERGKW